jgi:hypothetical protein
VLILLHVSKTWTLKKQDKARIVAEEMKLSRKNCKIHIAQPQEESRYKLTQITTCSGENKQL